MTTSPRTPARPTTTRARAVAAPAAFLGIVMPSACSVSAPPNLTVSPGKVATEAEDALEKVVGSRPDVDCGDEQVDLVDGTVVACELTDPTTGSRYDTAVTLSEVDGTSFHIDVDVAEEPKA